MPPPPGQKGTKKKGPNTGNRQPRSRNTTPSSVGPAMGKTDETSFLETRIKPFTNYKYEEIESQNGIPDSKVIQSLLEKLAELSDSVEAKSNAVDRGMRKLAVKRKERAEEDAQDRQDEEVARTKLRDEEERERKANKKREKESSKQKTEKERPLTHGAHGLAPQDGTSSAKSAAPTSPGSASSSLSPPNRDTSPDVSGSKKAHKSPVAEDDDDEESMDEHQPVPAAPVQHLQIFGDDPFRANDPTNYGIQKEHDGMTDDQRRKNAAVADFPHKSLADLIPGTPPDKDFSAAKPANQVQPNTFQTYLEQYTRPLAEDDLAFLRERGDRTTPFIIPPRGKHYLEAWASEDAATGSNPVRNTHQAQRPSNEARGSFDELSPEDAETDKVSTGPLASRLLSLLRPETRASADAAAADVDMSFDGGNVGMMDDMSMNMGMNGDGNGNGELDGLMDVNGMSDMSMMQPFPDMGMQPMNMNGMGGMGGMNGGMGDGMDMGMGMGGMGMGMGMGMGLNMAPLPPATQMPGSNTDAYRRAVHPVLDHQQVDQRLLQELIFMGFMKPDAKLPDYDGHFDDELAVRQRALMAQLKEISIINSARKSIIFDKAKDFMARQEFETIAEDLDTQINGSFSKRNRTLGKKKGKGKSGPGGTSGPGQAKPGIGDLTKTLMDRRKKWNNEVGPVFDGVDLSVPRSSEEQSSIFTPAAMAPHIAAETEKWDEDGEAEE